jgi:drug/metabolite transporter (DMT)-like permease
MAEMVTIDGQQFKKRNPLGVLGLTFLTLGVYFLVWYYMINDELRRADNDETISPIRSLMAMTFGWLLIVPPFIAMYNTAKHVQALETRRGVGQTVEPALTVVLMLILGFVNGIYVQEHLNRAWGATSAPARVPDGPDLVPTAS